ncbi:hypothetical protein DSO57_1021962 [Entomophthora muscae]|uniref:Uncharacterized protein n=1 Tax=Entomophthora muscae TaxID=34485 RepID=A0ACC2TQK7_9FUNG|nr:hypothetical protein DSO57_1021962 [Entomophthora muscae]
MHLDNASCVGGVFDKLISCFKLMLPAYAFVNLTSKLVFGLSKMLNNPAHELLKIVQKTLRSGVFIGAFVGAYQYFTCRVHNLARYIKKPAFIHVLYALAPMLASILSVPLESPLRLQTLNIFLAPKSLSSFYSILHSRDRLPKIPNFEVGLFSLSTGLTMMCFKHNRKTMDPLLLATISHFIEADINVDKLMNLLGN